MNESTPPFDQDRVARRRRRMKLIASGSVLFLLLEGVLLATLPKESVHGGILPGFILADALLALVVCAFLAVLLRKG